MRVAVDKPADAPPLGRRERNKLDKRVRITGAARRLFIELGYDDTTMRMIAQEADVGLGTVFAYAADKRDLLFLIINPELGVAWREAEADARAETTLLAQLRVLFGQLFVFFGSQPTLARYVLRELQFYKATEQAAHFEGVREKTIELVGELVAAAVAAGEVRKDLDIEFAARLIFSIYQAEIRRWLAAEELDAEVGTERLCRALELLMRGLAPQ